MTNCIKSKTHKCYKEKYIHKNNIYIFQEKSNEIYQNLFVSQWWIRCSILFAKHALKNVKTHTSSQNIFAHAKWRQKWSDEKNLEWKHISTKLILHDCENCQIVIRICLTQSTKLCEKIERTNYLNRNLTISSNFSRHF